MPDALQIDVCVATYKRPSQLRSLLNDLQVQQVPAGVTLRIIVVDNDRAASARSVVEEFKSRSVDVDYYLQPEQNIALTRNTALEQSQGDLIALIDDDESARSDWLATLLAAMNRFEADAVFGPVRGLLSPGSPRWLVEGRFFDRPARVTGSPVVLGGAGNVLMRASVVRRKLVFNPAYGLSGGEDTDFFHRLGRTGARMIWCEEALLTEHVHADRLCLQWLLRRGFTVGQIYADVVGRPRRTVGVLLWLGKRSAYALAACLLTLTALPFSRAVAASYAVKAARNVGQVSTVVGYRYRPYRS
jgi:succinoglycan biosynthesis protein ExoM